MADVIKGLTVKIGADTKDFNNALKDASKHIDNTHKRVDYLQKSLLLEWDENKFIQAQQLAQKALADTETKASALRERMTSLEEAGKVETDEYEKLNNELLKTENQAKKSLQQLNKINDLKMDRLKAQFKSVGEEVTNVGKKVSVISGASGAAIAGIIKLGTEAASTGAELQDYVDRLNISAEALQRWQYVALQSGVENETLYKSFSKARDAIGTAISGSSNAATAAISALIGDLNSLPTDTEAAYSIIINSLSKVKDKTLQAYYANEIFGERIATDLIPLVNQGSEQLNKFNKEFEAIGYLSNEQVASLAVFDDELNIVKEQLSLTTTELGVSLLPILQVFVNMLQNSVIPLIKSFSEWFNNLSPEMQTFVANLLLITTALGPTIIFVGKLIAGISTLIPLISKLKNLSSSTALGIASIAGAFMLVFDLIGNWKEMSTVEKVLKAVALAAMVAAAAITVFQASWSMGLAVGAIVSGIAVGIAAINAAKKDIMSDESGDDFNVADFNSTNGNLDLDNYRVPESTSATNTNYYNNESIDNSKYEIYVTVEENEYVSSDEIVEIVAERLALKLQSRS